MTQHTAAQRKKLSRNHSLDTLKFICAILVICIHTPQPHWFQLVINPLQRCAVPIFFMISGYFTYGKENTDKTIRKRIIHILKIFCFSYLLYMLIPIAHGRSLDIVAEVLKNNYENAKLLICYNYLTDGYHLWYLHAYIYVLVIVLFIDIFKLYKILFYAIPVLLLAGLYIGKYQEIIGGATFPPYLSRRMGREESLYIYIFHVFFANEVHTLLTKVGLLHYWEYIGIFAVLIATTIFIFILRKLKIIGKII